MQAAVAKRPVEQFETQAPIPDWQLEPDEEGTRVRVVESRPPRPGRGEVRPKRPQRQDAHRGTLSDEETEQFQRGGIRPVQVFHDKEHRLLGRQAPQNRQQGLQRPLLLLLR